MTNRRQSEQTFSDHAKERDDIEIQNHETYICIVETFVFYSMTDRPTDQSLETLMIIE